MNNNSNTFKNIECDMSDFMIKGPNDWAYKRYEPGQVISPDDEIIIDFSKKGVNNMVFECDMSKQILILFWMQKLTISSASINKL